MKWWKVLRPGRQRTTTVDPPPLDPALPGWRQLPHQLNVRLDAFAPPVDDRAPGELMGETLKRCPNCGTWTGLGTAVCAACGYRFEAPTPIAPPFARLRLSVLRFPEPLFPIADLWESPPPDQVLAGYLEQVRGWRAGVLAVLAGAGPVDGLSDRGRSVLHNVLQPPGGERIGGAMLITFFHLDTFPAFALDPSHGMKSDSLIDVFRWRGRILNSLASWFDAWEYPLDPGDVALLRRVLMPLAPPPPGYRLVCDQCLALGADAGDPGDPGEAPTCPTCGTWFQPGDRYCNTCGERLREDVAPSPAVQPDRHDCPLTGRDLLLMHCPGCGNEKDLASTCAVCGLVTAEPPHPVPIPACPFCAGQETPRESHGPYAYSVWLCPCGAIASGARAAVLDGVADQLLWMLDIDRRLREPMIRTDHPAIGLQHHDANTVRRDFGDLVRSRGLSFQPATLEDQGAELEVFWVKHSRTSG